AAGDTIMTSGAHFQDSRLPVHPILQPKTEHTPGDGIGFSAVSPVFWMGGRTAKQNAANAAKSVTNRLIPVRFRPKPAVELTSGRFTFGVSRPGGYTPDRAAYALCPVHCITPRNLLQGPTASLY